MADNLNPFFAEDDLIENEIEIDTPRAENIPCPDLLPESEGLTFDAIAVKLLKDNFILTALEFHTELIESGREVPRLRDFFSNPANFERTKQAELSSPGLPRTSSCQTFDSLDFARYSDDGDRQESDKVAVLEFELRKAQDTIKSLRASLTRTAETELPTPETPGDRIEEFAFETPGIRPYETRALNYLINEYLLQSDYKLTSVTFAEENENQDFEDWDDVGLNIPKPPDLLHLYRDFSQHILPKSDSTDFSSMVNMDEQLQESEQQLTCLTEQLQSQIKQLEEQLQLLRIENEFLSQQMKSLERFWTKDTRRHFLDVEANKLMRSSTPAVSPVCTPSKKENKEIHLNRALQNNATFNGTMSLDSEESKGESGSDSNKDGTIVPVAMETVDGREKDNAVIDSDKSESDTNVDSMAVEPGTQMHSPDFTIGEDSEKWQSAQRQISDPFHKALLNIAFHVAQDNRIVSEVSRITDSPNDVVLMLARCLPHVVPNVILAKREELIPLLLSTATLHPDPDQRDHLLNSLFNLIKRPDVDQRQMILTGCVAFAQHVGPTRVESELLPQCWEEITHKYPERRLLVAEACGALAPYLPNEIRSSLVLSMLNQMLQEDKTEEVRESVVKSLGLLMGFIDEKDKYSQGAELLRISLGDGSERVIAAAQQVFLPAFGMWASELGVLETNLIQSFVKDMEQLVKTAQASQPTNASNLPLDRNKFSLYVKTITELIPLLFASVLNSAPFQDKVNSVEDVNTINVLSRFPKPASELSNLSVIMGSAERLAAFVHLYEAYIGEEWYEPWEAYMWVAGDLIPQLLVILNVLDVASQSYVHCLAQLFYNLCRTFGRTFTMTKVKPKFHAVLNVPEDQQDANVPVGNTALTKCTVPVYVSGVLSAFNQEEDTNQLKSFLQDLLCTLALCHASLDSIKSAFTELSGNSDYHDLLLQVLWEGVVHTSAHVRAAAAQMFELLIKGVDETLVSTRVVPALVTLASDPEISVRIPTVSGFGMIMESVTSREMLDKVHMQFMTFMEDPIYKDQHGLYVELIRTFARIGPNAEPKFRDEFVLPRLAVLAASNNQTSNDTRRMDVALQLFEAYSALSCCFISDQLVSEAMLPGLKCLHKDMEYLMPDHAPVIASMIREFQDKLDASKSMDRNLNATGFTVTAPGTPPMQHVEEVRNKVMNRIKDSRPNLSKIFGKKNQNNQ